MPLWARGMARERRKGLKDELGVRIPGLDIWPWTQQNSIKRRVV